MHAIITANRRFLRPLKRTAQRAVRWIAPRAWTRDQLNKIYNLLGPEYHEWLYYTFGGWGHSKDGEARIQGGQWIIWFEGHRIITPIRSERMWYDWPQAFSLLGHDFSVKQTYRSLLRSSIRPDFFIDVGANFGVHSLLFLACHIKTISFEPNLDCHAEFKHLCAMNGLMPEIQGGQ